MTCDEWLDRKVSECILNGRRTTPEPDPPINRSFVPVETRRAAILAVSEIIFAQRGLHGTPTTEIARAAGISQAYLFRLFPTKSELFVALVRRCNERIYSAFADAAAAARAGGEDVLVAMGVAYATLLAERNLVLIWLQAQAACDDDAIRDETRRGFAALVEFVECEADGDDEAVREFFARGILLNVLAVIRAQDSDERWASLLLPPRNSCRSSSQSE